MKGKLVNRTGNFKHIFKRTIAPNQSVRINDIYKDYALKLTIEEFIIKLRSHVDSIRGLDVEGLEIEKPDLPKEIEAENRLEELKSDLSSITPKVLSELPYDDNTKYIIEQIDSTRLLAYARTLAKKNDKSKLLQKALTRRINQIKGIK